MPDSPCAAIVLAAGASTRLGRPKQLVKVEGETLLRRAVRLALEAGCSPVVVVLGSEAEAMRRETGDLDADVAVNPEWQTGMGSSLRCGVEAMEGHLPPPERVLVLLCDQPRLSPDVIRALLEKSDGALIAASCYAGRLGVPAVFRRELYPALRGVEGDRGARQIIERFRGEVSVVDFPGGEVDIDTEDDLKGLVSGGTPLPPM